MNNLTNSNSQIGKSIKRFEDHRLLTGKGNFIEDFKVDNMYYATILRSTYAHAKILNIDTQNALKLDGIRNILVGKDIKSISKPFPVGVQDNFTYYPIAIDKVRYVGEPVAVIISSDKYIGSDALELINVEYDPLPVVTKPEEAIKPNAPVLHENVGHNIAVHRSLNYGDLQSAISDSEHNIKETFHFPKYSSTPLETYGLVASYDSSLDVLTIWSNFHGPWTMFAVASKALQRPQDKLRLIVPGDIGGGFGIKTSIYPYLVLIGIAAIKTRVPIKWIETRREHLLASSSGTDRYSELETYFNSDGKILGLKTKIIDNVGAYIRAPEPGCLFRPLGNFTGPYQIHNVVIDGNVIVSNKCPTGPNRGYGCQQTYFGLERMIDLIALKLNKDPAEVRLTNLIQPNQFPYTTPTGGIYDAGNYPKVFNQVLNLSNYSNLRKLQIKKRKEGKFFGIGIGLAIDPSASNMGYVTVAIPPEIRESPNYNPKSGNLSTASVKVDISGKVVAEVDTNPQGQGHETVVAQIVANELGIKPEDISVNSNFDSFTKVWSIASGSYSSVFATMGASSVTFAARKVKDKILNIAAHLLEARIEDLKLENNNVFVIGSPDKLISFKRIAGTAHWNPALLPDDIDPGLQARHTFSMKVLKPPDKYDRVNSSATYGFIADIITVDIDPQTFEIKLTNYLSAHDSGTIINPKIVEGQIHGGAMHGIAGALYEELLYDDNGQLLTSTFMDYLCPTAYEAIDMKTEHIETPSPLTALGSKGAGEGNSESAPVAIANAIADALQPLNIKITELPLNSYKIWKLINDNLKK